MRIPLSTYRIQFHKDFGFAAAQKIIDYLHTLGISTIYASPIFKASAGSMHGYDVADPNQVNPEVGSAGELDSLFNKLAANNMTWLQDIVPNHMVFSSENKLLMDVMEKGYVSPYSKHFDIEWSHPNERLKKRVLVPFLGSPYHEILQKGELQLQYADAVLSVKYYQLELPLRIESYPALFQFSGDASTGEEQKFEEQITNIVSEFAEIASRKGAERVEQIEKAKQALWEVYSRDEEFKRLVNKQLEAINRDSNKLHQLLAKQYFRLAYWRIANRELNYRRFFNINELISIRVEDKSVFEHTHSFIFDLLRRNVCAGVRIDHIDGLNDPLTYLHLLHERAEEAYIVVEKILEPGEKLPANWPVHGTSGYDFMNTLNNTFCATTNKEAFQQLYTRFTGKNFVFHQLLYEKKRFILDRLFVGDLERLFVLFRRLSVLLPEGVDILQVDLREGLRVLLSCFPVYRTYINSPTVSEQDWHYIEEALELAKSKLPEQETVFSFLRKILLLEFPDYVTNVQKANWLRAVMKFQQVTGPLMAKGLEDTTFYIFNRFVSLNEVGGNPEAFGLTTEELHQTNREQSELWPYKINASATHDTKRGEDVRARLNVLSEIPGEWETQVQHWHEINKSSRQTIEGEVFPDKNEEYFLYQTLVGAWPFEETMPADFVERIEAYMLKAMKEAKVHTSWTIPDEAFEQALLSFTRKLLDPKHAFLETFKPFAKKIAYFGVFNSLAQTVLKVASPGVPDFYQGCELWDLSLVDPDNRRPVNYELRQQYLNEIKSIKDQELGSYARKLLASKEDGRVKLFTVFRALQLRNQYSEVFTHGEYIPLQVKGKRAGNVIAFARKRGEEVVVAVIPKYFTGLVKEGQLPLGEAVWADTSVELPAEISNLNWKNAFTNSGLERETSLSVSTVLGDFPVGLLVGQR